MPDILLYDSGNIYTNIPTNTTISGQISFSFIQSQEYTSGILEVTVYNQQGGVKVGFNGIELKTLIFDSNKSFTYTIKLPIIQQGNNTVHLWSSNSNSQIVTRVIVKQSITQGVIRKDSINKIINKLEKLYSFYKNSKEGINGLPSLPRKVWQQDKVTKSKIDEIKNLINTLYGTTYTCYYYSDNKINDEVLNQIYLRISNYLPQAQCYSCDYYTPCQCDGSCFTYSGCSCDNSCHGYSNCSCYITCNQERCTCNSKQYNKCSCYNTTYSNQCYCYKSVYTIGCSCDYTCNGYSSCSCNNTCNGYSSCSCDNRCYGYYCYCNSSCFGYNPCSCDSTCNGYTSCSCNNTCYGVTSCSCNNTCNGYKSCSCNNTCNGYKTCSCDDTCYGYKSCSCDYTRYL